MGSSWQGRILLAASILSSYFLRTQAQESTISIALIPPDAIQGQSITLKPDPGPAAIFSCNWYRGLSVTNLIITYYPSAPDKPLTGDAYTGRETVDAGCSLHIRDLSLSDSGNYTLQYTGVQLSQLGTASITVLDKLPAPSLWSRGPLLVAEDGSVTLYCNTSESAEVTVSWFRDGDPVPAHFMLLDNNRTLSVTGIAREDGGNYTCVASNRANDARSNPLTVTVAYGPNGVAMNETGMVYAGLGSFLALRCLAVSVPGPQFRWFFNGTDQNRSTDTFSAELKSKEDQGNYTCQAINKVSGLTASTFVFVQLMDQAAGSGCPNCLSPGQIAGIVIGCIAGVALIAAILYFVFTRTALGRTEQHASNGNVPSAPGRNQGATDTKPTSGEEDIQYSTLAFSAKNPPPPQPNPAASRPLDSNIIYSEIKKK